MVGDGRTGISCPEEMLFTVNGESGWISGRHSVDIFRVFC